MIELLIDMKEGVEPEGDECRHRDDRRCEQEACQDNDHGMQVRRLLCILAAAGLLLEQGGGQPFEEVEKVRSHGGTRSGVTERR